MTHNEYACVDVSETIKFYQARSVDSSARSVKHKQYFIVMSIELVSYIFRCIEIIYLWACGQIL